MATAAACPHSASYMLAVHVFRCCSVVPSPFGDTVVPLHGSQLLCHCMADTVVPLHGSQLLCHCMTYSCATTWQPTVVPLHGSQLLCHYMAANCCATTWQILLCHYMAANCCATTWQILLCRYMTYSCATTWQPTVVPLHGRYCCATTWQPAVVPPHGRYCCATTWQILLCHYMAANCCATTWHTVVPLHGSQLLCHYMADTVVPLHGSQLWLTVATRPPFPLDCMFGTVHLVGLGILNTAANVSSSCLEMWLPHVQNETLEQTVQSVPAGDSGRRGRDVRRHALPNLPHLPPSAVHMSCNDWRSFWAASPRDVRRRQTASSAAKFFMNTPSLKFRYFLWWRQHAGQYELERNAVTFCPVRSTCSIARQSPLFCRLSAKRPILPQTLNICVSHKTLIWNTF